MSYPYMRKSSRRLTNTIKNTGGFSLVELLVVVAILAILAAIAIPLFLNQKGKAQMGVLKSDAHNVIVGIESAKKSDNTLGTNNEVKNIVLETIGKTTSPSFFYVWPNCAINTAGTGVEVSPGNYILQGYRESSPGSLSVAPNTTYLNYNSKTQAWSTDSAVWGLPHPLNSGCRAVNGGQEAFALMWSNLNVFS